jgi:predicted  nucleic acid-binding Zn-ribbon protein
MAATADNLRDLHHLHQRARALRDRLSSAPKTLAARQAALTARQAEHEAARKAVQDAKVQLKKHEHALQGLESKIDDLKVKLNQVRKNDEYKALQNQIAHDQTARAKLEEEILLALEAIETKTAQVAQLEADVKRVAAETTALKAQIEEQSAAHRSQLRELETAITAAETIIPENSRDQYRRIVGRYGADALAACEDGACLGCFTAVTAQMWNDLINDETLTFCLSCGRLLYRAEEELADPRRT